MTLKVKLSHQTEGFTLNVNQALPSKGLTAIFGPSGCGKTTLLRCIAGLNKGVGTISLNETNWQSTGANQWLPAHKRNLAYVFQDARLLPHLNVLQNIELNMKLRGVIKTATEIEEITKACGLTSLLEQWPHQLSGGQKQRACLARALLCEPDLILMDEPLSALDSKARQEAIQYLQAFKVQTKVPILYVTHSVEEVSQLADHILILDQGEAIHFGSTLQTFAKNSLLFESSQVASVFEAKVIEISSVHQLAKAQLLHNDQLETTHVWLPGTGLSEGKQVRLRVSARDVSISLNHNKEQSILNSLPAVVSDICCITESNTVRVSLALGSNTLHAQITQRSLEHLQLKAGQKIWAQVKALSVFD